MLSLAMSIIEWLGIAAFSVAGAMVAINKKLDVFGVCICSIVTSIGGGIIRDIMANEIPGVLNKDFYATAAILGSVILWYSLQIMPRIIACYLCIALTFALRVMAIVFKMGLPTVDFQEEV